MRFKTFIQDKWWPVASVDWHPDWRTTVERWHLPAILVALGDRDVDSLTPETLEVWWVAIRREKPAGIANKILVTVKSIFKKAEVWGYVQKNPAVHLRRRRLSGGVGRAALNATTTDQLIQNANSRLGPYLIVARYTGARRRSLLDLQWRDISFSERTIRFRATKNGDDQTLPLHPALERFLESRRAGAEPGAHVLSRYTPGGLSRAFRRLCQRSGLGGYRFHDTRHAAASQLAGQGASLPEIQQFLGHRDLRSTMRYVHPTQGSLERTVSKL